MGELNVTVIELYDYIIENTAKIDDTLAYLTPLMNGNYAYKQANIDDVVL